MAKRHDLKVWPLWFQAIWDGDKTAEFRRDDRDFAVGDILVLREYDPGTPEFTGRKVEVRVTHITTSAGVGIPDGYVMMSFWATWKGIDGDMISAREEP
jgi:hypothetical protein